MKTDLASLKKEFVRLTDVAVLKKELNRLSAEIRKFDLATAIPTAQKKRLEKRYRELKNRLTDLQKSLDLSFAKVSSFVRQAAGRASQTSKTTTAKKATSKKTSRKTAASPARKKVSKKVTRRSSK
jgi:ABC-type phosphate transport system auxiliary subunit